MTVLYLLMALAAVALIVAGAALRSRDPDEYQRRAAQRDLDRWARSGGGRR
jgi:hypothetical protein